MPAPTITALPDAPLRSEDPSTFTLKAEAFVAALAEFVSDANALAEYLEDLVGSRFYRFAGFFTSVPTADETLGLHVAAEAFTLPANFAGAFGKIGINPTSSFVITVYQNPTFTGLLITGGTNIGTITVSTGGVFTFATAGGTSKSILQGEMLGFKGPTTPDATAACAAFTLEGTI